MNESMSNGSKMKWIMPVAVIGGAVGVTYALTRKRKPSRWDVARRVTSRLSEGREELGETGRDIISRLQTIYQESRKVIEEATDLWHRGRHLVRA